MSHCEAKLWLCCVRFVTVMVRVTAPEAALTTPKSSSFGEKTTGSCTTPDASAGRACVCAVEFAAVTVMLPGPVPVSAMLHSPPAASVVPQFVACVNPPADRNLHTGRLRRSQVA